MKKSMEIVQKFLIPHLEGPIGNYVEEPQNSEYEAFVLRVGPVSFRSRRAKKTPTKKGYFVVFWEKDRKNQNQAFSYEQGPDYVLVTIVDNAHKGFFLFPKSVLVEQKIGRNNDSKGKMAIRVYPSWEKDLNSTAKKTQRWQTKWFIDLSTDDRKSAKIKALLRDSDN